jgi:gluconokinase
MHGIPRQSALRTEEWSGMRQSVVVMGVSGCGKTTLAVALAQAEGAVMVEGDALHSDANREKMKRGIALTDADRAGWLDILAGKLAEQPRDTVLTCSALKRAYRDRLRAAAPGLRFVFMEITREEAQRRVASRGPHYFTSPALVDNQFATLESPAGEPGVLRVDGTAPIAQLVDEVSQWLRADTDRG